MFILIGLTVTSGVFGLRFLNGTFYMIIVTKVVFIDTY